MKPTIVHARNIEDHMKQYADFRIMLDVENAKGYLPRPDDREMLEQEFKEFYENPANGRVIFARAHGAYVGFAQFTAVEGIDMANLHYLFVNPNARKQGTGSTLVQAAIDDARKAGCSMLYVENAPASKEFYRRLGFKQIIPQFEEMILELK